MTATLQSYTTGTVAVTNGSDIVTLTGGAWLESWCVPGSDIRIAGESTAMVIEEWIDTTHIRLSIPIQRATAAGLTYAILMTSAAFGTNRLGALTAVERIRLMTENAVINQLLGVASGALAIPALQDRIGIWDASDDMNAKPGTLASALKAGTSVLTKSVNYAVTVDDYGSLVAMSAGTGARTATLPAAATAGAGFVVGVKKTDASANAVTVAAAGADTIDGATSLALTVQYGTVILRCDGAAWHVVVLENTSAFARTFLSGANAAAVQAILGVAPKQADGYDATVGAGLINGAWGLGTNATTTWNGSADDITVTGFYRAHSTTTGTPTTFGTIVHIGRSGTNSEATQIFHSITSPSNGFYTRSKVSSVWSAWKRLDPESGTTSTGSWWRVGGMQVCTQRVRLSDIITTTIMGSTWTYPMAFAVVPRVLHTPIQGSLGDTGPGFGDRFHPETSGTNASSVSLRTIAAAGSFVSGNYIDVDATAIGPY